MEADETESLDTIKLQRSRPLLRIFQENLFILLFIFLTIWMIIHFYEMPINTKKVVLYSDWLILKQIV